MSNRIHTLAHADMEGVQQGVVGLHIEFYFTCIGNDTIVTATSHDLVHFFAGADIDFK